MATIGDWLRELGLECYAKAFQDNDIDLRVLRQLSEGDLESLGVSMGHRKRLALALAAEDAGTATEPATPRWGSTLVRSSDGGERRQVTAIFCDVVNSTGLAAQMDPEVWRGVLRLYEKACQRAIAEFDGYVFQLMGDGVVAYFGYPIAHEDAPVRAIRACLRILESLSQHVVTEDVPLQVRIGIATGLVVVDDIRSRERSAVGHTMNLAARLQSIAQPGEIVVSDATHRLAAGAFEYRDGGEVRLKGIAQAEHVWQVTGLGHAEGRFDAATRSAVSPLIGRDEEIATLLECWAETCRGRGQAVFLSGEPGVGKSRLLHAMRERMTIAASSVVYCQCAPFFANSAFYPIIECLDRGLRNAPQDAGATKRSRLEATLRTTFARPPRDVLLIGSMFSLAGPQGEGLEEITPQRQREETIRALVDLVEAISRDRPALMVLEDVHWADPSTLQTLDLLFTRLADMPLMLVVTHRPEFARRWPGDVAPRTIALTRLNRSECVKLAMGVSAERLPIELLERIVDKTDGVPLYVEELVRTVIESRAAQDAAPRDDPGGADLGVFVPATLRDSLMERLDRLEDDKVIAQIGSVLGREFSFEMLQAVTDWSEEELELALQRLVASGLVLHRGKEVGAAYFFKHALVQEAAYDSLLRSTRQQVHRRIGETLEARFVDLRQLHPELLAHHYGEAGLHGDAVRFWSEAGRNAAARSANVEAINHLRAGLQRLKEFGSERERDASELQLQTLLGNTLMAVKGYGSPEVGATFGRARELCDILGDTPGRFPVLRGLWMFYLVRGELVVAAQLAEQVLQLAARAEKSGAWLEAHRAMGMTCFFRGEFTKARVHLERALEIHDPREHREHAVLYGTDPAAACSCYLAATLWILGLPDRAVALMRVGVQAATDSAHGFSRSFAMFFAAMLHQYRREPTEARASADADIEFSREGGYVLWLAMALVVRGWADVVEGPSDEGMAGMRRGWETYRATGARLAHTYIASLLAEAWQRCGRHADADALIAEAHRVRLLSGERVFEAELFRVEGESMLQAVPRDARGRFDPTARDVQGGPLRTAEAKFLRALRIARTQRAKVFELRAAIGLYRIRRDGDLAQDARDLLVAAHDAFTEGHDTADLREARRLLDAVDADDADVGATPRPRDAADVQAASYQSARVSGKPAAPSAGRTSSV